MKKFILFIIFCTSFLYAQDPAGVGTLTKDNWINAGGGSYKYFWTPTFVDTTYTQTANTILIDYNAIKGDTLKTVGGSRLNYEYTRVWRDSTNIILGGTFDDSTNWNIISSPLSFTIEGGVISFDYIVMGGSTGGFGQGVLKPNTKYTMSFSLTNVSGLGSRARFYFSRGDVYNGIPAFLAPYNGLESFKAGDTSIVVTTSSSTWTAGKYLALICDGSGSFDFDDYSIYERVDLVDSVVGSQYTIDITEANDSTWYYYDYLVGWKQKDKDTVWVRSDMDSVFIPDFYIEPEPDHFYIVNKDGGKLLGKSNYAIKFKD